MGHLVFPVRVKHPSWTTPYKQMCVATRALVKNLGRSAYPVGADLPAKGLRSSPGVIGR
ncbi:hypothetical protein AWT69_002163 [Pseudomonas putida]|nr:hypothetical protein AWT69_002163 [Pseudomonas putida]